MILWFVFLLSFLVRATQIPNFKWSQTKEDLSITAYYDPSKIVRLKGQAEIKMDTTDFTPVTKNYEVLDEWLNLSWNNFSLNIHLREDVVPKDSWCKWKEQFVVCKLRKKHAHIFDFLSTRDQIADFKRYGTLDWEATTVGEDVDIYEFDGIPMLTKDDIQKQMGGKLILRTFYPWCDKCREEQESFEAARRDKRLRKKKFKFGVVDAREDRVGAKFMNAQCSDICNFVVYVKQRKFTVKGKKKKREFVDEIILEVEDPWIKIKTQARLEKLKKKHIVVAGYFDGAHPIALSTFEATAKEMKRKKEIKFALLPQENPNWAKALTNGADRVILFNKKRKYYRGDLVDKKNFTNWVEVYSSGPFEKYSYDLKKKFDSVGLNLPILKVFLNDDKPKKKLKRQLESLGEEYKEKMLFFWYAENQDHQMKDLGLQKEKKPAFGISSTIKEDAKHYASFEPINIKNIRDHIELYFDGKLEQTFKTQPDPYATLNETEQWELGKVQEVVQSTFKQEILKSDYDVALLLHKNWTTHKNSAKDQMFALAKLCAKIDTLKVATYDYHENYFDAEKYDIKKHSSDLFLFFVPKHGGEWIKAEGSIYQSEWTIRTLSDFVVQHHKRGTEINLMVNQYEVFFKQKERELAEREEEEIAASGGEDEPVDPHTEL